MQVELKIPCFLDLLFLKILLDKFKLKDIDNVQVIKKLLLFFLQKYIYKTLSEHYIEKIGKVTKDDINRIARKMLTTKPSVAATGSLKNLPSFKDIELGLLHKDGQMPKKKQFSVFR